MPQNQSSKAISTLGEPSESKCGQLGMEIKDWRNNVFALDVRRLVISNQRYFI